MSKMKHTPEPWVVLEGYGGTETTIFSGAKRVAHSTHHSIFGRDAIVEYEQNGEIQSLRDPMAPEGEANAARIVACVNACAGMEDPEGEIAKLREAVEYWKTRAQQ